jgi:hypothetical protein
VGGKTEAEKGRKEAEEESEKAKHKGQHRRREEGLPIHIISGPTVSPPTVVAM